MEIWECYWVNMFMIVSDLSKFCSILFVFSQDSRFTIFIFVSLMTLQKFVFLELRAHIEHSC